LRDKRSRASKSTFRSCRFDGVTREMRAIRPATFAAGLKSAPCSDAAARAVHDARMRWPDRSPNGAEVAFARRSDTRFAEGNMHRASAIAAVAIAVAGLQGCSTMDRINAQDFTPYSGTKAASQARNANAADTVSSAIADTLLLPITATSWALGYRYDAPTHSMRQTANDWGWASYPPHTARGPASTTGSATSSAPHAPSATSGATSSAGGSIGGGTGSTSGGTTTGTTGGTPAMGSTMSSGPSPEPGARSSAAPGSMGPSGAGGGTSGGATGAGTGGTSGQ
jgi:hypothetical protein